MVISMEITADSQQRIDEYARLADDAPEAMVASLTTAAVAGSEDIRSQLMQGRLGLKMQNPASGLAACVFGWMVDESAPLAAVGVPPNTPASGYARIQNDGGRIVPRTAKALAIPISAEAKQYSSPRDMQGLTLIPRPGRPPLLVRQLAARGARKANWELHWVLVASVTIRGTRWAERGADNAADVMAGAFESRLGEFIEEWN